MFKSVQLYSHLADKEKKKKKKEKVVEAPPAEAAPAPAPAPAPEPEKKPSQASRGSTKQAKRTGSNIFSMFSQRQVQEFKEGFQLMDRDKDGIINKNDLRATFDEIGRIVPEKELDEMINEAPGPINFTMLLTMFAERMSGGTDEDDVVVNAFKSFDEEGVIDSERLRHALMTWGDKFSGAEVDTAYEQFEMDNQGRINTTKLIELLVASPNQEEEGAEAAA
ncbi:hypothetical protein QYM36_015932 [Artemia franciscana]|uniref:EF-hand domain-containing protein n=1 Tax=Artemia franciscana TaxID=6661 RepID=A0AA88HIN6_ARTSF|nr:hypothetical protein QYM36_015932 [Artemia franciscana]